MFSQIRDTVVCELLTCPRQRATHWDPGLEAHACEAPGGLDTWGTILMPHPCNDEGAGLGHSRLVKITASLNSDEASKHIFQAYIHIDTFVHVAILKVLHSAALSRLPSCWNTLNLEFQSSHLSMEGEARKPKHGSPRLPPEALQSGLLTWTCVSKSGKRIQNHTCEVSPRIFKKAKPPGQASCSDRLKRTVSETQNPGG